jgi:hypothetical protein
MIIPLQSHKQQNGSKIKYYLEPFCGLSRPILLLVRERGLEPPSLAALAPHASVYTIPPLARGVKNNCTTIA